MYMNKSGFKCVRIQLAKTNGRDPQEHSRVSGYFRDDPQKMEQELKKLRVVAPEHDDAQVSP